MPRARFSRVLPLVVCVPLAACVSTGQANRDRTGAETSADAPSFTWAGVVSRDHWVYVRNVNGPVRVEQGSGPTVEVSAVKRWRYGNPDEVTITVRQTEANSGDVVVCALWSTRDSCDEAGHHRGASLWRGKSMNDVSVAFTIRVPAGVRVDASSVNGTLVIDGVRGAVVARTTNGSIAAHALGGPVTAETTNGSIDVTANVLANGSNRYTSTNGSISVGLPASINADLDMRTVNGRVSSELPVTLDGVFERNRVHGKLGTGGANGGPTVSIRTVNGSVWLKKS